MNKKAGLARVVRHRIRMDSTSPIRTGRTRGTDAGGIIAFFVPIAMSVPYVRIHREIVALRTAQRCRLVVVP